MLKKLRGTPRFDIRTFKSTMSDDEKARIRKKVHECQDRGDLDGASDWLGKLPLLPDIAMCILRDPAKGPEYLLEDGAFNLDDAEAFYGKDWIERYGLKTAAKD